MCIERCEIMLAIFVVATCAIWICYGIMLVRHYKALWRRSSFLDSRITSIELFVRNEKREISEKDKKKKE